MLTYPEIYKSIEEFVLKRLEDVKKRSEIDQPPIGWEWLKQFEKGYGINIACGNNPMTESVNIDSAVMLGNIFHCLMSGDNLHSISPNSVDYVICNCPEVFHSPLSAFNEWYRVLKPGGICAIVALDADSFQLGDSPMTRRRSSLFNLKILNFYLKKSGFKFRSGESLNKQIRIVMEKV